MIRRNTIQRALVLDAVNKLRCHATADEIHSELSKIHPGISSGTVYRNLRLLCEAGEIRRCEVPGGADRYDHLLSEHYHAKCDSCGRIFDVDMDVIRDLESSIKDARGFTVTGHDVYFKGVCEECKANN